MNFRSGRTWASMAHLQSGAAARAVRGGSVSVPTWAGAKHNRRMRNPEGLANLPVSVNTSHLARGFNCPFVSGL